MHAGFGRRVVALHGAADQRADINRDDWSDPKKLDSRVPLGRFGKPEDIADVVVLRLEPVAADCAKRRHVGVANPVSDTHQDARQAPLLSIMGARSAAAASKS